MAQELSGANACVWCAGSGACNSVFEVWPGNPGANSRSRHFATASPAQQPENDRTLGTILHAIPTEVGPCWLWHVLALQPRSGCALATWPFDTRGRPLCDLAGFYFNSGNAGVATVHLFFRALHRAQE